MSIFGKCLALRTTTVILWATGWYDRDTCSSPLLMHFCEEETAGEGPSRGCGGAWGGSGVLRAGAQPDRRRCHAAGGREGHVPTATPTRSETARVGRGRSLVVRAAVPEAGLAPSPGCDCSS